MLRSAIVASALAAILAAPIAAGAPAATLRYEQLPPDHVLTDLTSTLSLRLSPGPLLFFEVVDDEAEASVLVKQIPCGQNCAKGSTAVSLVNMLERRLKVDLHLSRDGERWQYTSSCPLSANELWPHPVAFLAISNPRFVTDDDRVCR